MDDSQQSPIERARQLLNQGPAVNQPTDHQQPRVASEDTTMDWTADDSDANTEFTRERFEAMTKSEFPDTDGAGMFNPGFLKSTTGFFNTASLESMTGTLATAESSTPVPDAHNSVSTTQPEIDKPTPPTNSRGNTTSDCTPRATPETIADGVDTILRRCLACKKQKRRCTGGIPCDLCSHRGKTADECEADVNYKRRKKADLKTTPAQEKIKSKPKAKMDDKESPASGSNKAESSGSADEAEAARLRTLTPAPAPATFMSAAPAAQLTDNNTSAPTTPNVSSMSVDAQPAMPSPESPLPSHALGSASGSSLTTALSSTASNKSSMAPSDITAVPATTMTGAPASAEPTVQNMTSAAGNDKQPSNDASTTPAGSPQSSSILPLQSSAPASVSADETQKSAPKKRAATPKRAAGEKKAAATPKEKKTPTPRKRATKADQPKGTSATAIKGSGLRNEIFPSEASSSSTSPRETPPTSSSSQQQHGTAFDSSPHPVADCIDVSNLLDPAAFAAHARDPDGAFARSPHASSPAALTSFSRFLEASRQALASNAALLPADDRARLSASASPTLAAILAAPTASDDNDTAPQHSPRPGPAALPLDGRQSIDVPDRIPRTSPVAAKRGASTPLAGSAPKRLRGGEESPLAAALRDDADAPTHQQEEVPGLALSAAEWKAVVAYAPGVGDSTYARLTRYEAVLAEAERYHVWYARTFGAEGEVVAYGVPSPGHNWARLRLDLPMPAMWNVVLRPQPDWPVGTRGRSG